MIVTVRDSSHYGEINQNSQLPEALGRFLQPGKNSGTGLEDVSATNRALRLWSE